MKLYATVTSERATKGQGGEYLNIVITDNTQRECARLVVTDEENGIVVSYDFDEDTTIMERWKGLELATTKGNDQKGECKHEWEAAICTKCGDAAPAY
jgi:hypothetical protein